MAAVTDPYAHVEDDDYIKVSAEEGSEFMEIPKEDDESVFLSTIQTQFPDAIGLKCKGSSGAWRAIRSVENVLAPPKGGWGDKMYCITVSDTRKRKSEAMDNKHEHKASKRPSSDPLLKDMAVVGLPYKMDTEELKEYFETNCGEVAFCEVKYDRTTGKSRGFGFVRFKDIVSAKSAAETTHYLEGRHVGVKPKEVKPMKLFVGRLPGGTTKEMLTDHFSKFGDLKDVYIPTPFRKFAFITYACSEDGKDALRDTHMLEGARLNVEERKPETKNAANLNDQSLGGRSRSSNNGYMTRDYQTEKYGGLGSQNLNQNSNQDLLNQSLNQSLNQNLNQNSNQNPGADLKTMLFQFLAKSM